MPCSVSTGLIYKAYSLGLVHFTGETLSVSFQKFCSTDGSDSMGLGASHFNFEESGAFFLMTWSLGLRDLRIFERLDSLLV